MSEDLTNKLPANDDAKLTGVMSAIRDLSSKVRELDQKVEERLFDTRPMWEKIVENVRQLQEGQLRLEQGQSQLHEGQGRLEIGQETLRQDVKTFQRDILRRMSIFNDTLVTMQADYRDIYDRVRGLELKGS